MEHLQQDLHDLITKGKTQGYLTYDEVNEYLPDDDVTPDKLDNLLMALDEQGIELVDQPPSKDFQEEKSPPAPTAVKPPSPAPRPPPLCAATAPRSRTTCPPDRRRHHRLA